MDYVTLRTGARMPMIGYGVCQIPPRETARLVSEALEAGYRHLDTAQSYRNEEGVGAAAAASGIPRGELFLTTKVWPGFYGEQETRAAVLRSLDKLRTGYLDLVLLHQPYGDHYGAWRALEALYREGAVRAAGVSKFYPDRLADLCGFAEIPPMVNQVETHPLFQQRGARELMRRLGVVHESWAPFGESRGGLFENETLHSIAGRPGRSTAQVMLRWQL
ncbi:aldo/keto reductase [Mesosutterella faecium]|uniref:aldo/keto reductase n=1 Tax=Mesosutterella faecium TaxID=2925194 RepID=UPI0030EEE1A1